MSASKGTPGNPLPVYVMPEEYAAWLAEGDRMGVSPEEALMLFSLEGLERRLTAERKNSRTAVVVSLTTKGSEKSLGD